MSNDLDLAIEELEKAHAISASRLDNAITNLVVAEAVKSSAYAQCSLLEDQLLRLKARKQEQGGETKEDT